MGVGRLIWAFLCVLFRNRAFLTAENLALRQQLLVLQRAAKRPKLHNCDRVFWSWRPRLWTGWRSALLIVQPATVVRWHRLDFRLYGRWKSRRTSGRPAIDAEVRDLIRRMSRENSTRGAPTHPVRTGPSGPRRR
jgi:putative transposase